MYRATFTCLLLASIAPRALGAPGEYLLSHAKVLRTPDATFTAIYLSPNQYHRTPGYRPTPVGNLLSDAAERLAKEAGDFVVDSFSRFYAHDPKAMDYVRTVLAPSVKNGEILDGHSNLLLIYRRPNVPDSAQSTSRAELVGVLEGTWVTPGEPRFPFQDGNGPSWPEVQGKGRVDVSPFRQERTESREIKHLAVREGTPEDITAMLAYFGSQYGVMGTRQEQLWNNRFQTVYSRPDTFFLRCLPLLVSYYQRRAGFRIDEQLSGPGGAVMSLPAADWSEQSVLQMAIPGRIPLKSLLAAGRVESLEPANFVMTLDDAKEYRELPTAEALVERLANGDFHAVTQAERCERAYHDLVRRGFSPETRVSPGFRGTINP